MEIRDTSFLVQLEAKENIESFPLPQVWRFLHSLGMYRSVGKNKLGYASFAKLSDKVGQMGAIDILLHGLNSFYWTGAFIFPVLIGNHFCEKC